MDQHRSTNELGNLTATFPRYSVKSLLRTMAVLALAYILLLVYLHYTSEADIGKFLGGSAGLSVFRNADRVEAYRIDKPADRNAWRTTSPMEFRVISGPVSVSAANVQALRNTLQDRNLYLKTNLRKACIPLPGVRLDFIHGDDRLSVLICFECDIIEDFLNGKPVGGENSDNMRPALVRVVHSLFPDDPVIQDLR